MRTGLTLTVVFGLAGVQCAGQPSGIAYTDGRVLLNGRSVASYAPLTVSDVIECELGRAEVVLAAGVVLRIDENSVVRVVSNTAEAPGFDLLTGRVSLEVARSAFADEVTGAWRKSTIVFYRPGFYRLDTDPAAVRVLDGEAEVTLEGKTARVGKGDVLVLEGDWSLAKIDRDAADDFDRWCAQRAAYRNVAELLAAYGFQTSPTCPGWDSVNRTITCVVERDRGRRRGTSTRSASSETQSASETDETSARPRSVSTTSAGTSGTIAAGSRNSTSAGSSSSAPVSRDPGNAGARRR